MLFFIKNYYREFLLDKKIMESAYQINIKSSKEKKLVEKTLKKNEYLNFDLTLSHPVTIKVLILDIISS